MTDGETHAERMRALERLRGIETGVSERVETLRRWLAVDLARAAGEAGLGSAPSAPARALRNELWWRPPEPGGPVAADRATLDRIGVLAEWLAETDRALVAAGGPAYAPGRGDGAPLEGILTPLFTDLAEAERLRATAGIRPT